jgi:hypothetical protein
MYEIIKFGDRLVKLESDIWYLLFYEKMIIYKLLIK